MKPNLKKLEAAVAAFNQRVKVGDVVNYQEVKGSGTPTAYRTRSKAEILSGHTAVVWLEGKSGCVCIDHCSIGVTLTQPQPTQA